MTIAWISRGGFFGTHSLFGRVARTENAVAVTACELLVLDGDSLRQFLHTHPEATELLLEEVIRRWPGCLYRLSDTALLDVRERTASVLARLCERFGEVEPDGSVRVQDLTQPELAAWVGASRETINRVLQLFARSGWVRIEDGTIRVINPCAMQACIQ